MGLAYLFDLVLAFMWAGLPYFCNWVWLSLGRFGGVELTCARILFPSYLGLPYFLLGSGLVLVGSGLPSTWVWLTFEQLGGEKIRFGEVWLTPRSG